MILLIFFKENKNSIVNLAYKLTGGSNNDIKSKFINLIQSIYKE